MENKLKEIEETHRLWHGFEYCFMDNFKFILRGYSLMRAVRTFANQNPKIKIIQCDDMMATASMLVLIPHCNYTSREGITIVSIPQNVGDPSVLYLDNSEISDIIKFLSTQEKSM